MIIIGVTGGIGSGKSYICRLMEEEFGIPVYDCDREAKRLNVESEEIRRELTRLVGDKVYREDGGLDKDVLAGYLFQSPENARKVNAVCHPAVARDFQEWTRRQSCGIVAMESAILFESGFDGLTDYQVSVSAPEDLRMERVLMRDNTTREAVERRQKMQIKDEERNRMCRFVITNDGRDVRSQIQNIIEQLKKENAIC